MAVIYTKQTIGNKVLIKMKADTKAELVRNFYKFINFGNSVSIKRGADIEATTGLTPLNISFTEAYFTANIDRLIRTLASIELFKVSEKYDMEGIKVPRDIVTKIRKLAEKNYNNIPEESIFLNAAEETEYLTVG